MSVYAIADAINRLADKYEKVMKEKNEIEREKLEFEKEKHKQLTNPECNHEWELLDEWFDDNIKRVLQRYLCKRCGETEFRAENDSRQNSEPEECKHNWVVSNAEAVTKEEAGCVTYYTQRCSICGKERLKKVEFDGNHKPNVTIWELKT